MLLGCAVFLSGCGASSNSATSALNPDGATPTTALADKVGGSAGATTSTRVAAAGAADAAQQPQSTLATASTTKSIAPSSSTTGVNDPNVAKAIESITAAAKPGSTAYKIGPQDLLEISVFKVPELSKSVQVAESGTINLPLLGEVRAVGQTARELERDLTTQLGAKYLQNPQVTVYVREYNSQRVTLEGAGIKKPGVYALKGRMTLLQLVATADGLSDISDSEIAIFRQSNAKKDAARFNVASIRSGEAEDPELVAGDVIVASTSTTKEVFNNVLKAVPLATALRPF